MTDFLNDATLNRESELNRFIDTKIQPDEAFLRKCGIVIDNISRYLRHIPTDHEWPYSVNKMVKGGSLGKGTAMLEKSDVDVVLFLNGLKSLEDYLDKLPFLLTKLQEFLILFPQQSNSVTLTVNTTTRRAVKFTIMIICGASAHEMEVDLLPCCLVEINEGFYQQLEGLRHSDRSVPIFVERQRDFVAQQPTRVKSLIRLVKYWRYHCIPSGRGFPSSYLFELLSIYAWEQAGRPGRFNMVQMFRLVLEHLVNHQELTVVWYKYYPNVSPLHFSCPIIIDPANPTVNLCQYGKWEEIADKAKSTLRCPMLTGVEAEEESEQESEESSCVII